MRTLKFRFWKNGELQGYKELSPENKIIDMAWDWDIVEQFAGKTDKNGKDIYEGDILQYHNVISTVTWDEENLIYIAISNSFRFDLTSWEGCEIIGNIHDNPGRHI